MVQVAISDVATRVISVARTFAETVGITFLFSLEYPVIPTFLLPAPPYALFAWATNLETLFVLGIAISIAIIASTAYVFSRRHELFEHPVERFFGRRKRQR